MSAPSAQVKNEESALANGPATAAARSLRQRLVLCLDGTWNTRDSGTNVYHLSNLIQEGEVGSGDDRWIQHIYYDQGVGTGLLDGVTGGAFGIGLEENIREAYDWLVERYDDGDEIYIFGFSRGAFTARSLVGLIARCGLLYRGAPLSLNELWHGYQILGRHPHERTQSVPAKNWWERIFGRPPKPFRAIWELKREVWEQDDEDHRRVPVKAPVNRTEHLLITWSRRVRITCVGVFDTVGSMGREALAIPWVREYTAQFHDLHLTSIIVHGLHALAIDEHRANFSHMPWQRRADASLPPDGTPGKGRIEQRWFVGAHSNIGGGYELDHRVALEPDGMPAERRRSWMEDMYLRFRLFAIGAFVVGIVIFLVKIWPWLLRGAPLPEVLWLLWLNVLMLLFGASAAWTAAAMYEAGLGSIVQLQNARTPAQVMGFLSSWAAGGTDPLDKRCLMPVVRTIWRDCLGFIPVYSVLLFSGSWLFLSLIKCKYFASGNERLVLGLLVHAWQVWGLAAAGTLLCALADYVEDAIHLWYIKRFPEAPSPRAVRGAVIATWTKVGLFLMWILAVCGAATLLSWQQLQRVLYGETGGLSAAACLRFSGVIRFKQPY